MKKKWAIILVLGVIVIGGGGYWAFQQFKTEPATASMITAVVKKGDITQTISATGTVNYPEEVPLAFEQSGKIQEVYVEIGDKVTAVQALAQVDTETLQQEVTESVASLREAELNWQQQKVEAEGALVKAKEAVQTAKQNADPAYLENQLHIAEQNVEIASNNLAKAQQGGDEASILQAKSSLTQAQANLITIQNTYNGGAARNVESAQADLEIAQAKLSRLNEKTSLAQAQTAVVKAQDNLAKATLVAPSDGVIIDIAAKKGQTVNNSTTVMTLAAGGDLLIVESSVSQEEVTEIKAGQKANISLDSALDNKLPATVTQVSLKGTTTQNVTTFLVTMQMDKITDQLRPGMNANVEIVVAEAKDVLTVPSSAIQTRGDLKGVLVQGSTTIPRESQASRQESWQAPPESASAESPSTDSPSAESSARAQRPRNSQSQGSSAPSSSASNSQEARSQAAGTPQFVPVEVGLDDGTNVEIKGGLTEGQVIVIGTRPTTSSNTNFNDNRSMDTQTRIPGVSGGGGGFGGGAPPMR